MFSVYPFPCDDWENIYTLSYYHHQIGSMNYYPLFRVRSWNNGVRCMSFCILMNLWYGWMASWDALSRTDKVPRQPTSLPMLMPDALTGEVPGIRSALGRPMTHLKDTTPPIDHPHPWHPRMRKRDPHARLLTNAAFRWSLDPHPHQTETFPVHPGAIYSQCPTWTFTLSVNYVSEKTTQQLHARVETVYAINVIREGTSPEHVSYRTRGLAASPL